MRLLKSLFGKFKESFALTNKREESLAKLMRENRGAASKLGLSRSAAHFPALEENIVNYDRPKRS